jgi:hypothetical protein
MLHRLRGLLWLLGAVHLVACGSRRDHEPLQPSSDDVLQVVIDTDAPTRPISPYVYGINGLEHATEAGMYTLLRLGGTRYSTYNWENNASNAGHDPPANQNDGYLCDSTEPGAAVLQGLDRARALGAALLVTVPMCGHVARDRNADGDVEQSPDHLRTRFLRSLARGGTGETPSLDDDVVHQDAFVRFVRRHARERGVPVFFALDNEPGGWNVTLPRVRGNRPATYREIVASTIEHGAMIRDEAPESRIFGPVSFGWADMRHLGRAPDGAGRDFLGHYLQNLRNAERARGRRLLDVLDVHWYPVMEVEGEPVSGPSDALRVAQVRMQLPRSLYDAEYREPGWIVRDDLHEPVHLLPRLNEMIDRDYPGTGVAITEYAYGGSAHPSGAVAQADALGAFGRLGVFAAAYWPLTNQQHTYALSAFRMFRRIDGGVSFGDRSLEARSNDVTRLSAWASLDSQVPGRVVVVLIGRGDAPTTARVILRGQSPRPARRFLLHADGGANGTGPRPEGALQPDTEGVYAVPIPARSVTTLIVDAAAPRAE